MIMYCTCYKAVFGFGEKHMNYTHNIYIYVNIGILPPNVMYHIDALAIKFETASREPNIFNCMPIE